MVLLFSLRGWGVEANFSFGEIIVMELFGCDGELVKRHYWCCRYETFPVLYEVIMALSWLCVRLHNT